MSSLPTPVQPASAETKHTPGPWHRQPSHRDGYFVVHAPVDGYSIVCSVGNAGMTSDHKPTAKKQREFAGANARLIAAAPELLAALREIVDASDAFDESLDSEARCQIALDVARAALAKAEAA